VLDASSTVVPESGEVRRLIRPRVLVLCVGCAESLADWLLTPHELADVLYPEPGRAGV
jgi:hypothetical protein